MIQDWHIQSRAEKCARTGRPFEEGEPVYTLLHEEPEGLRREDVSQEAWNKLRGKKDAPEGVTFWRSKFEPPPPVAPEAVNRADAETHLRRLLAEGPPPDKANVAYLLAALLERKRVLKPVAASVTESKTHARVMPYEHAKTGEMFLVPDSPPALDQLEAVQQELTALLGAPNGVETKA
jgi:hypothetical protein